MWCALCRESTCSNPSSPCTPLSYPTALLLPRSTPRIHPSPFSSGNSLLVILLWVGLPDFLFRRERSHAVWRPFRPHAKLLQAIRCTQLHEHVQHCDVSPLPPTPSINSFKPHAVCKHPPGAPWAHCVLSQNTSRIQNKGVYTTLCLQVPRWYHDLQLHRRHDRVVSTRCSHQTI